MGVMRITEWPDLRRGQFKPGELLQSVYVEFDDKAIKNNVPGVGVRIESSTAEFDALQGQGKIEWKMLSLILCWDVIVHKLQETTVDRAVDDSNSRLHTKGLEPG
ncbi:hypothetical protein JTB14_034359 [Gonioctena quinquepunctata]|nr:hypothetical protein JTB14_034359 [Gonioctena quinquepunctata]